MEAASGRTIAQNGSQGHHEPPNCNQRAALCGAKRKLCSPGTPKTAGGSGSNRNRNSAGPPPPSAAQRGGEERAGHDPAWGSQGGRDCLSPRWRGRLRATGGARSSSTRICGACASAQRPDCTTRAGPLPGAREPGRAPWRFRGSGWAGELIGRPARCWAHPPHGPRVQPGQPEPGSLPPPKACSGQ
ncbi:uncharacterized protein LOC111816433 [Octodon degus]|uniref:Uncharacterized protein LOC111816433 n=1 Tax=Octodon degus TaxID=10160 RepID=A0A6P6EBZ8_OCTDE|nr:uncharacterized protein LOC111816433 [Octodon degus]